MSDRPTGIHHHELGDPGEAREHFDAEHMASARPRELTLEEDRDEDADGHDGGPDQGEAELDR